MLEVINSFSSNVGLVKLSKFNERYHVEINISGIKTQYSTSSPVMAEGLYKDAVQMLKETEGWDG